MVCGSRCHLSRKQKQIDLTKPKLVKIKTSTKARLNIILEGSSTEEYDVFSDIEIQKSILEGDSVINGKVSKVGEKLNKWLNLPSGTIVKIKTEYLIEDHFENGYKCAVSYDDFQKTFLVKGGKTKNPKRKNNGKAMIVLVDF